MKKNDHVLHPHILVGSVFSPEEIEKIHGLVEQYDLYHGRIGGKNTSIEEIEKVRISNIRFFERNGKAVFDTEWIFNRVDDVIKQVNEMYFDFELYSYQSFQYTTYEGERKGTYNWHMDSFTGRTKEEDERYPRKLSMSVFLNEDYEGGEFEVCTGSQEKARKFRGKPGDAIVFPSFMIHRVAPVTKGIRKSLVVWVEGPRWK